MVGEFPELQGLMGKYYAEAQGEDEAVAHACEDHYKPKGPDDLVPADPVSVAVALADKIDTLVGFWAIDEKPTGSKDPYALRRAALGVIRLIIDNEASLALVFGDYGRLARSTMACGLMADCGADMIRGSLVDGLSSARSDEGSESKLEQLALLTSSRSSPTA